MKKLISIILTLSLVLGLCTTAFADTASYKGYKLLNLTFSHKTPVTCDGTNHKDDCYNYAYTVNPTYREILQKEVSATDPSAVTDEEIVAYFVELDDDEDELREVADRIYRAIQKASIGADAVMSATDDSSIASGYWMIADVTNLEKQNAANSLVMLDTKGQESIDINPKTALPEFEKKVKDINDSEDGDIKNNAWQDAADHDLNDAVPFKLTGTLPANVGSYESYEMIFHDTLGTGFTLLPGTFKVYMYNTKDAADVDTALTDTNKVDVTDYFDTPVTAVSEFTVSCDNVKAIEGATAGTAFVVYYEATLDSDAVMGSDGNVNSAYLEYSNNPYDDDKTGESPVDMVKVFTYQVSIDKVDKDNNPVKGAGFTLYKKNSAGTYEPVGAEVKGTDMTTFVWERLDDGDYKLVETTVPSGYNKAKDIMFTIGAAHSETAADPELTSLSAGDTFTGTVSTGTVERDVVNTTGIVLPETGAGGTMMLIGGGALLIALAAVFMVTRKKMSIYED